MGRTYLFECTKCGYRAKVSGSEDSGVQFGVKTILCRDCKELYDAVTALKVPLASPLNRWKLKSSRLDAVVAPIKPPRFHAVLNRLPPMGRKFRWMRFKPACPVTPTHRIEEWKQPGKCPRCGILLEANAMPFRRWD
jgi:hypothetical protein